MRTGGDMSRGGLEPKELATKDRSFVALFHGSLRPSVPKQPPSKENEKANDDSRSHQRATAHCGSKGPGGANVHAVEIQNATERPGTCPGTEPCNGIPAQADLHREPREVEGLMEAARGLGPISDKRAGRQETTTGPKTRQIHHDVISGSAYLDGFPVHGKTEVGENVERKAHNSDTNGGTMKGRPG